MSAKLAGLDAARIEYLADRQQVMADESVIAPFEQETAAVLRAALQLVRELGKIVNESKAPESPYYVVTVSELRAILDRTAEAPR